MLANVKANGDAIVEIMERSGYHRARFASEVGISPSYLTLILKGEKPGSADVLKRMAAVLKCPVTALIRDPEAATK
jgi:transcriptional regulator with XRE-family HTH domain